MLGCGQLGRTVPPWGRPSGVADLARSSPLLGTSLRSGRTFSRSGRGRSQQAHRQNGAPPGWCRRRAPGGVCRSCCGGYRAAWPARTPWHRPCRPSQVRRPHRDGVDEPCDIAEYEVDHFPAGLATSRPALGAASPGGMGLKGPRAPRQCSGFPAMPGENLAGHVSCQGSASFRPFLSDPVATVVPCLSRAFPSRRRRRPAFLA